MNGMSAWSTVVVGAVAVVGVAACGRARSSTSNASSSSAAGAAAAAPRVAGLAAVGTAAPVFDAVAHNGYQVSLAALRGKPVVLYFYPKDDSPGCTKEACEIRDAWRDLVKSGAVVLGVSTDDQASHVAFAKKYNLPFLLLSDQDKRICHAYGVPVHLGFAKRVTFIIDRQGNIARVFPDVTPTGHAAQILAALAELPS